MNNQMLAQAAAYQKVRAAQAFVGVQEDLATVTDDVAALVTTVDEVGVEVTELEGDVTALVTTVGEVELDVIDVVADVAAANVTIADHEDRITALEP